MHAFVLQASDPETGCPAIEARLSVADPSALREIVGASEADHSLRHGCDFSDVQLKAIEQVFGCNFQPGGRPVRLLPWRKLRELPYLVHTEFELALMLEGRKPLAAFADAASWLNEHLRPFERHVASGRLTRRDFDQAEFREVYFALPGHEWRVGAYRLLRDIGAKHGWSEKYERLQGKLLGYQDWENDAWAKARLAWQGRH